MGGNRFIRNGGNLRGIICGEIDTTLCSAVSIPYTDIEVNALRGSLVLPVGRRGKLDDEIPSSCI